MTLLWIILACAVALYALALLTLVAIAPDPDESVEYPAAPVWDFTGNARGRRIDVEDR